MNFGDIFVSIPQIKKQAKNNGIGFDEELYRMIVHGILHLVGYDHEIDNGEHRQKEEELIKQFNLPNSLIIRTQG